jgi:hypothetical protein
VPDPADARKQAVARPRWRRRAAGALRDDGLQWRCAVEDGGGGRRHQVKGGRLSGPDGWE